MFTHVGDLWLAVYRYFLLRCNLHKGTYLKYQRSRVWTNSFASVTDTSSPHSPHRIPPCDRHLDLFRYILGFLFLDHHIVVPVPDLSTNGKTGLPCVWLLRLSSVLGIRSCCCVSEQYMFLFIAEPCSSYDYVTTCLSVLLLTDTWVVSSLWWL